MEYYSKTLNDRILGIVRETESDSEYGYDNPKSTFKTTETLNAPIDVNPRMTTDVDPRRTIFIENTETELDSDLSESDLQYYLDIIDDIVNTLIYIHECETVHRDLKPK